MTTESVNPKSVGTPAGNGLTPTMMLKRKPIAEQYAAAIEALYAS
ncbi:MAG: hypothetical protein O7B23_15290 [Deltaproteobacteria bacterium]|nr:hypothetical protein [Deltaproteobacteria bacterium]